MSVRKPNQWIPLHIDDFMSRTEHLSTQERGAYLLLLFYYWRNQEPLPDSDKQLARIAGLTPDEWDESSPLIRPFFNVIGDKLHNKRIDTEISKAVGISEKRQAAGKRGGRPLKSEKKANEKQMLSGKKANALQVLSKSKPIGVANVNTRACNGPLSETSKAATGWEPDFDVLEFMDKQESEWHKCPSYKAVRKKTLAMRVRGVS